MKRASRMQPIRYDARQVALMLRVAMFYHPESVMASTGRSRRELNAMADQKTAPTKPVLDYFRLTVDGAEYVWDPKLDYKSNPCWGPILTFSSEEVIQNGAAIHHAARTIESSFADR
jgi:hypothetical protein